MSLEQILKRIEEDAGAAIQKLQEDTSRKLQEIEEQTDAGIKALEAKKHAETAEDIENEKKRRMSIKRLALRNNTLRLKHELIDEAFKKAFSKAAELPAEEYKSLMERFFADFAEPGKGKIFISRKDKDLINDEFIARALNKISAPGREYGYETADEFVPIEGGFIIETESTKIDCSLEALFLKTREALEAETAGLLFKNG